MLNGTGITVKVEVASGVFSLEDEEPASAVTVELVPALETGQTVVEIGVDEVTKTVELAGQCFTVEAQLVIVATEVE